MLKRPTLLLALALTACAGGTKDGDTDLPADTDAVTDTDVVDTDVADTDVVAQDPVLQSVSPTRAIAGDTVTLTGAHFGDAEGSVFVEGADATVLSWSDDTITVEVPFVLPGAHPISLVTAVGVEASGVSVETTLPRRAYVAKGVSTAQTNNGVAVFDVSATGALTEIAGSPFDVGTQAGWTFGGVPGNITVDEANARLFVGGDDATAVFQINLRSGALTPVLGSPFATVEGQNLGLAVSADGEDLYVSHCGVPAIAHFLVDGSGALAASPGPAVDTNACGDQVLLTGDGGHAFVTAAASLYTFELAANGAPSELSPATTPYGVSRRTYGATLAPGGERLFVPTYNYDAVFVFDVGVDGGLTGVAGSPFALDHNPGDEAMGMAFTPDGAHAFLALWNGAGVSTFDVDPSGALTWTGEVPTVAEPAPITVSADGAWLFVLGQDSHALEVFSVGADGGLTSAGAPTILAVDDYPQGVVLTGF
jgi:6-phosphogluconolactonase (cycloisomerase 2 family)